MVDAIAEVSRWTPSSPNSRRKKPKKDLVQELEKLGTADQVTSLNDARLKRELKTRLADTSPDRGDSSGHCRSIRCDVKQCKKEIGRNIV